MAFGTQDEPDEVMNEINMTPLVDVMLVLLIVFIITVPVMKPMFLIPACWAAALTWAPRSERTSLSPRICKSG